MKLKILRQIWVMSRFIFYGTFLQVLLFGLLKADDSSGQKQSVYDIFINVSYQDITLDEVLDDIQDKTGFNFTYNHDVVDERAKVNISAENQSLGEILSKISADNHLMFRRIDGNIHVSKTKHKIKASKLKFGYHVIEQLKVNGTVTSIEDGEPLPGVSIIVKGTTIGTTTDVDGKYTMEVPNGTTLQFSYIGFETLEVEVGNRSVVDVKLQPDLEQLEEVVVVGYGIQKKSDITGAISSVKSEVIADKPITTFEQAMEGRLAGVTVQQNSGQPGGGISVRVRGITSLTGSNEPLYVVDGVMIDASNNNETVNFSTFGGGSGQTRVSALSSINPSDIESIEVLKDASATAIYGPRGANGVVILTTKKGKSGKSKISFESYLGSQSPSTKIDMMNLREYAQYQNEIREQIGQEGPLEFQRPERLGDGTDWQEEIFRTAPVQSHQLSVSGGNDKTSFYTSMNYFNQEGILINTGFERLSFRLNVDHRVNKWFKIGNSITLSGSEEQVTLTDASDGIIAGAVRQSPDIAVRFSDGSWGGPTPEQGVGGGNNPVAWSSIRNSTLQRKRVLGNLFAEIDFHKNLKFRSSLGYDLNINNTKYFNPTYSIGLNENTVSESYRRNSNNLYWQNSNYLTYSNSIKDHDFSVMVGQEAQKNQYESLAAGRNNYFTNEVQEIDAGDLENATNSGGQSIWTMFSVFGRVNYSYKNRYLVTSNIRVNGSSNFGPGHKWGTFPSFSVGWVISEESFFNSPRESFMNWFKVRFGYGEVGNQAGVPEYAYGAKLRNTPSAYGTAFSQQNIANPILSWETLVSTNLGVEMGFFQDRIRLEVDLYDKNSDGFLLSPQNPDYLGATTTQSWMGLNPAIINAGVMSNKGIDLNLKTINIDKNNFTWSTNIVFSHYKNTLESLPKGINELNEVFEWDNLLSKTTVGQSVGMFYGFQVDGIFQDQQTIDNSPFQTADTEPGDIRWKNNHTDMIDDGSGNMIPDPNQVIDAKDKVTIGNPNPDFTFGFGNDFKIGAFDVSIFFTGSYGNEIYNWNRRYTEGMIDIYGNSSPIVMNRWTPENTNTDIPRFARNDPNGNGSFVSDRFIEDGSYIRIQNFTVGYTLPTSLLSKIDVSRLRVYLTAQNLYTFTNYSGYDPAIGSYNNNARLSGLDAGRYPVPRIIQMGFNLDF